MIFFFSVGSSAKLSHTSFFLHERFIGLEVERDKKGTNQAWLLWPHFFWHIPYSYFVDRANNFLFTKCESWGEIFLKRDELIRKCMWKITAKTKYATFWRPSRKEKNKLLKVEKKRKKRMKESNRKKSGEIGKNGKQRNAEKWEIFRK